MKKYTVEQSLALSLICFLFGGILLLCAQKKQTTATNTISYRVLSGPISPIQGDSNALNASIEVTDGTTVIEQLNFDVPLNSFNGFNSDYLSMIANDTANPALSFKSKSVKKLDNGDYIANGYLNFRRTSSSVQIRFKKMPSSNQLVLKGDFRLRPRDYFIGRIPPRRLVANWIPFEITLAFDADTVNGEVVS